MRPQEIDKIANLVVKALATSPEAGLLGCGSLSSTTEYATDCTPFTCGAGGYECGVAALFSCDFFFCGAEGGVFVCDDAFACDGECYCYGVPGGSHAFAPPPL